MTLIIATGSAARITRLITTDKITEPMRNALLPVIAQTRRNRRAIARGEPVPPPTPLRAAIVYQLTCPWCIGMWVSLACITAAQLITGFPAWQIIPAALTTSYIVGWAASTEPTPHDPDQDGDDL